LCNISELVVWNPLCAGKRKTTNKLEIFLLLKVLGGVVLEETRSFAN